MKKSRNIITILMMAVILFSFISCEKDTDQRNVTYFVKGLTSEYKLTYLVNGENKTVVNQGGNFSYTFTADRGEILYFDIKYKDEVDKMSPFASMITVNGEVLKESYAYDIKWADSATVDIPYPYEIILKGTVPY